MKSHVLTVFCPCLLSAAFVAIFASHGCAAEKIAETITVRPELYTGPLANPLAGFMMGDVGQHQWATLARTYIKWSDIESQASDGTEKIREYCDMRWADIEYRGIKVIPRVYLHWPPDKNHWPSDMTTGDYSSPQFEERVLRLISNLGQAWNDDPRVAFIEMGIIGKWGEHHSPDVTPRMQKLLGDAFSKAFTHKKVLVRHPWDFVGYSFGVYWDSWAHQDQMASHGQGIKKLGLKWQVVPMGGETAYDWGNYRTQPGSDPTDTVSDPKHRTFLINTIRDLHNTYLGWVSGYDAHDPIAASGAAEVQAAMGYRFTVDEFNYPSMVAPGGQLSVSFVVRNVGSAAFYYHWPVELSLIDKTTLKPVWKHIIEGVDISKWLPGDKWSKPRQVYDIEPLPNAISTSTSLPTTLRKGEYILALGILDPWGKPSIPAIRFAVKSCLADGRCPIGVVGIGVRPKNLSVPPSVLTEPSSGRPVYLVDDRSEIDGN